jgi:opacity protein-like surface antigen
MKRLVRYSTLIALIAACRVGTADAQTAAAAPADRWYAELMAAATLGHKSDSSIGGELGYGWTDERQLFLEIGRMGNVATSALDDRAQIIGRAIGASVSTAQKATYFDVGLKYRLAPRGMWRPYGLLGLGAARVTTDTHFAINGNDVTNQLNQFGVQQGSDLFGSVTKFFLTVGVGANVPFGKRYLADLSYRYGRIFPRSGAIENDTGVNTQRVQAGIGIRF